MKRYRLGRLCAVSLVVFLAAALCTAQEQRGPSDEEIEKITAAAPNEPRVEPNKPRKLLVFSKSYGYYHTAIPYGKAAIKVLGEKTGAFEAVISDDISMFEPENLSQFDAVFLNNINEEVFVPENLQKLPLKEYLNAVNTDRRLKRSLIDFLKSGKGLVATHAATNAFQHWYEYGNIIGARFDNHPWEAGSIVALRVEDPNHPLTQAFEKPFFQISDEIYQHKNPYSRDKVRVLLSIDPQRTSVKLDHVPWIHRSDNDFPITWIKSYGKGRVFYCALGHQHELFWNPVVLQHYLDGIQFALGDIKADTTPSAKLQKPKPGGR